MLTTLVIMGVDFNQHWNTIWGPIQSQAPGLVRFLGGLGVLLAIAAIGTYMWQMKRQGKGNNQALAVALVIAAVLCGPQVLIPLLLKFGSLVANILIAVFSGLFK